MKKLTKIVSLILICLLAVPLSSCSKNNPQPETTTTVVETTEKAPAETTVPTPEPTAAPTPTPEPTPTPTPSPTPVPKTFSKVFSVMASTMGKSVDQAQKLVEDFTGASLGSAQVYKQNHNYDTDVTIEGVHFNNVTLHTGTGKYKNKVVFVAFNNSTDGKKELQSYYSKYTKLLKKKYKKGQIVLKNKNTKVSLYKINKTYETNTGWFYDGKTKGFWINYYISSQYK